jgi:hypothetical protein
MEQRDRSAEVVLAQEVRRALAARAALERATGERTAGERTSHGPGGDPTAAVRQLDPRLLGEPPGREHGAGRH